MMNDITLEMDNIIKQSKGYWIGLDIEGYKIYDCKCSKCSKNPLDLVYGSENWWMIELPKYCPNCGSEMETDIENNKIVDEIINNWDKY